MKRINVSCAAIDAVVAAVQDDLGWLEINVHEFIQNAVYNIGIAKRMLNGEDHPKALQHTARAAALLLLATTELAGGEK